MKHKVTIRVTYEFDPYILEVKAFKWEENGDLTLFDDRQFWRFPYKVLEFVHMEVIDYEWP